MIYILVLLIVLPVLILTCWLDHTNKKHEENIKDLKRLIYKIHDELNSIKRKNRDNKRYK